MSYFFLKLTLKYLPYLYEGKGNDNWKILPKGRVMGVVGSIEI